MNDRYLYRAKSTDNGEWVKGSLITGAFFRLGQDIPYILCPDKADYDCFEYFSEENGIFEVDPSTICQCTGLKDKNGNLIFENDLLECKTREFIQKEEHFITQVEWDSTAAGFLIQDSINSFVGLDGIGKGGIYECEIIGNIFDSSDVLDGRVN